MPVIETETVEADDEAKPDWIDQMAMATERVWDVAETLKEDRLLMAGARHLLEVAEIFPSGLGRRVFDAVAACLMLEAAELQRKSRPGQGPKSER